MAEDRFFRLAFFALFTILTLIRLYFKLRANVFRETIFSREESVVLIAARAILGLPLLGAIFVYLLFPGRFLWMRLSVPLSLRWTGICLAGLSLGILIWVHLALGKNFATSIRLKNGHTLVKTGPYGLIRHPMYSAYFVLFLAAFLITENWVIGASGAAVILLLMTVRLRFEEDLLVGRFGKDYVAYRELTPKFLPRPPFPKPAAGPEERREIKETTGNLPPPSYEV